MALFSNSEVCNRSQQMPHYCNSCSVCMHCLCY